MFRQCFRRVGGTKILQVTAAILAGGESRRMGADKAALLFGGVPLLERAARAARAAGLPVLVAGRNRPTDWPLPAVEFAPDAAPGLGPLGGLETALRHTGTALLALACDMPLLSPDALLWLRDLAAATSGLHGLAVTREGRWEPLFSVYTPACLPLIASRLTEGRRSLHGLIEAGDFGIVEAPAWVAAQLVNVNTMDDLARLSEERSELAADHQPEGTP